MVAPVLQMRVREEEPPGPGHPQCGPSSMALSKGGRPDTACRDGQGWGRTEVPREEPGLPQRRKPRPEVAINTRGEGLSN